MKKLETLTRSQVEAPTQAIFDTLKKKVGMVPNLYATVAHSHSALVGLLGLGENLGNGEFSGREVEAIALAVGQANNCDYCLAAHTAVGKLQGLTEEETIAIRSGEIGDIKLQALSTLAIAITETRGFPSQQLINAFFEAGYSKAALAELVGYVALNTFTNYFNSIAETELDFPKAPATYAAP